MPEDETVELPVELPAIVMFMPDIVEFIVEFPAPIMAPDGIQVKAVETMPSRIDMVCVQFEISSVGVSTPYDALPSVTYSDDHVGRVEIGC